MGRVVPFSMRQDANRVASSNPFTIPTQETQKHATKTSSLKHKKKRTSYVPCRTTLDSVAPRPTFFRAFYNLKRFPIEMFSPV